MKTVNVFRLVLDIFHALLSLGRKIDSVASEQAEQRVILDEIQDTLGKPSEGDLEASVELQLFAGSLAGIASNAQAVADRLATIATGEEPQGN